MAELIIAKFGSSGGGSGDSKTDISSATVTLASGTLTYDGTPKTQAVASVVVGGQTLTAGTDYNVINNSYTNAGSYTLTVSGMGNYEGNKNVAWSIEKATGSVSVNPGSLSISGANETATSIVTVVGDGGVSVSSSDSSVATASISGSTVTVTSVAGGSATITVTLGVGTNYTGDSATINVSVVAISPTLSDNTPEQIQQAAQMGIASNLWSVGAMTAPISIDAVGNMSATSACAFIIGFDHNSSKEGTNRIHFQFGKTTSGTDIAFCDSGYVSQKTSGAWFNMNNSSTNNGGWNNSLMRTVICPAFLTALPAAWENAIASTTKYTDNTGGSSNTASYVTATTDDIFLLAEYEVFGARSYANSAEQNNQVQYDYYKNGNARIFYKHNATSTACYWWLRSPYAYRSDSFCYVTADGSASTGNANYSLCFAPGFCIA